jgi:hypothetical protein
MDDHSQRFLDCSPLSCSRPQPSVRATRVCVGVPLLLELAQAVLQYRIDIILFRVLLNFYASEPESTIADVLPQVLRFAREAVACQDTAVRLGGMQLQMRQGDLRTGHRGEDQAIDGVFNAFKRRES